MPKFKDGTLVVINLPNTHYHGFIGLFEFRGPEYETCIVRQGCSVVTVYPSMVEEYNMYDHGRVPMERE